MRVATVTRGLGATALLGAGVLGWASLVEVGWFVLRRVEVPVLTPGARPLRVLHLSDLHVVPGQRRKVAWVRALARLRPDLVVNTGDNMAFPEALEQAQHSLEPLLNFPGAFVLGSNDYYAATPKNPLRYLRADPRRHDLQPTRELPAGELAQVLRDGGWVDLTNRRDVVVLDGQRVELVGVDDAHLDRDDYPARTGAGTPSDDAVLRLGVAHSPYRRVLDAMHADDVHLVLAGHTHGGQLCVPGWGALVTNCDLDPRRAKGLHGWPGPRPDAPGGAGSTWLHVSAGLGTSPYAPVRFACRPEVTLLTLVPR